MSNSKVILVADDDENDVFFLRRAFAKSGLLHTLIHVSDGQKAIEYLLGEGIYANRNSNPFPDLLLLDLKMPKTDGFDVLATLQSLPQLELPVVVFSTSALTVDVQAAKKTRRAGLRNEAGGSGRNVESRIKSTRAMALGNFAGEKRICQRSCAGEVQRSVNFIESWQLSFGRDFHQL